MADDTPTVSSYASIFGGDTGLTYQELQRQRAIAQALASKEQPYPHNIGEGIFSAARSLAEGWDARRLEQMRLRQAGLEKDIVGHTPPPGYTPRGAPAAPIPAAPPPGSAPLVGGGTMTVTPPAPGAGSTVPRQVSSIDDITDALMANPYAGFGVG
jgi:hypothetical protein